MPIIIIIIIIIIMWLVLEWMLQYPRVTSMQKALMENTSAEMSPTAHQANADKLGGRKPDNSLESPLGCPNVPGRKKII